MFLKFKNISKNYKNLRLNKPQITVQETYEKLLDK